MDGRGCWRDNVFVERLWRSLKYEEVYLHAYETVGAAQQGMARYLTFYNQQRPHRALDGRRPIRCTAPTGRAAYRCVVSNPPGATYERANTVQPTGATSYSIVSCFDAVCKTGMLYPWLPHVNESVFWTHMLPWVLPKETVKGVFGDPKTRVFTVARRSKKQRAASAVGYIAAGTTARLVGCGICPAPTRASIWKSKCGAFAANLWQREARKARFSGGQPAVH